MEHIITKINKIKTFKRFLTCVERTLTYFREFELFFKCDFCVNSFLKYFEYFEKNPPCWVQSRPLWPFMDF